MNITVVGTGYVGLSLAVLLLFILGVTSIREFALPLMIGVVSGTYSSICIATELWFEMKIHQRTSAKDSGKKKSK